MKLFVTHLNFRTSETFLRRLFETVGTVDSCKLITDRETGKSRGFAFVEMPNELEAKNAIEKFNESDIDGRKVIVKISEERPEKSGASRENKQRRQDNRDRNRY